MTSKIYRDVTTGVIYCACGADLSQYGSVCRCHNSYMYPAADVVALLSATHGKGPVTRSPKRKSDPNG